MTLYNFDMPLFWLKFIDDIETSRNGDIPQNIAPGRRCWQISIPANTTATVYIPAVNKDAISESHLPVSESEGVKFLGIENRSVVFNVGSGKYEFIVNKN
jgi:hypothetical protein